MSLSHAPDSPRWCEICKAYGDHHTDRHTEVLPLPTRLLMVAETLDQIAMDEGLTTEQYLAIDTEASVLRDMVEELTR